MSHLFHLSASMCLHDVAQRMSNLLCYATHPEPEPLDDAWLDARRQDVSTATLSAINSDACTHLGEPLRKQLIKAQSLCFELSALLHKNPTLSTVRVQDWTVPRFRELFDDLSAAEREIKRLGDTEKAAFDRMQKLIHQESVGVTTATSPWGEMSPDNALRALDDQIEKVRILIRSLEKMDAPISNAVAYRCRLAMQWLGYFPYELPQNLRPVAATFTRKQNALCHLSEKAIDRLAKRMKLDGAKLLANDEAEWHHALLGEPGSDFATLTPGAAAFASMNQLPNADAASTAIQPDDEAASLRWPPDGGWHFREGEAAFRGIAFPIQGKPWLLLKRLAAKPGSPVSRRLLLDAVGTDYTVSGDALRSYLSEARSVLRAAFELTPERDPIPNVDRGELAAWKIDENVFP